MGQLTHGRLFELALALGLGFGSSLGGGCFSSSAQAQVAPPELVATQVSPSGYLVQGRTELGSFANRNFISNAGFIVLPRSVVVVDALGSPELARRLIALVRSITPRPITHVIVTHYHADHIYGLQEFRAIGARIVAHRAAQAYLGSEAARTRLEASRLELAPWVNSETQLTTPDLWLDSETHWTVDGVALHIKPVGPAHTAEDTVVYLPSEKLLFAGDLVFRARIPFVGQADSRQWIKSLDALLALDPHVIVPGHGPASKAAREDMQLTRDYLLHLRASMGPAAKNMDPFEDAYQATDWRKFEALPLFKQANRMNAYNTYLLMEREGR